MSDFSRNDAVGSGGGTRVGEAMQGLLDAIEALDAEVQAVGIARRLAVPLARARYALIGPPTPDAPFWLDTEPV